MPIFLNIIRLIKHVIRVLIRRNRIEIENPTILRVLRYELRFVSNKDT